MNMSLLVLTQVLRSFPWHLAPLKTLLWAKSQHREVAWVSQGLIGPRELVSDEWSLYDRSTCSTPVAWS